MGDFKAEGDHEDVSALVRSMTEKTGRGEEGTRDSRP
jgi:hypothetical protein